MIKTFIKMQIKLKKQYKNRQLNIFILLESTLFVWFLALAEAITEFYRAVIYSANLSLSPMLSENWHSGARNKNCVKKGHCVQLLS